MVGDDMGIYTVVGNQNMVSLMHSALVSGTYVR